MTLNQVISRLKAIAENHKKVNHFFFGDVADWMSNGALEFPSVRVEISEFTSNAAGNTYPCKMVICDLCLQTPEDRNDTTLKANDIEVQSDMVSVANDIIAIVDHPSYEDWKLQGDARGEVFGKHAFDENEHEVAGVMLEFEIFVPVARDHCEVPVRVEIENV